MRRLWVGCLLVSLLLAQTLGQLHAVHHGGAGQVASAAHDRHDGHESHAAHEAHDANQDNDFLQVAFSPHQNETECRLYDQVRDLQVMPTVATILLPNAPPRWAVAIFQGDALARWAALFDARGPPLTV